MKVKDVIDRVGLKIDEERDYVGGVFKDGKMISPGYWKPSGKKYVTGTFAPDGRLLYNNIDKDLIFGYSYGPITMFAFKSMGKIMTYEANSLSENITSRNIFRYREMKNFLRRLEMIEKDSKKEKIYIKDCEFDVYVLNEQLNGDQL